MDCNINLELSLEKKSDNNAQETVYNPTESCCRTHATDLHDVSPEFSEGLNERGRLPPVCSGKTPVGMIADASSLKVVATSNDDANAPCGFAMDSKSQNKCLQASSFTCMYISILPVIVLLAC